MSRSDELRGRRLRAFCATQIPLLAAFVRWGRVCPVCTACAELRMENIKCQQKEPVLLGACSEQAGEQEEEGEEKQPKQQQKRQPWVTGELLVTWEFCRGNHFLPLCNTMHLTPSHTDGTAPLLSTALGISALGVKLNSDSTDRCREGAWRAGQDEGSSFTFHSSQQSAFLR